MIAYTFVMTIGRIDGSTKVITGNTNDDNGADDFQRATKSITTSYIMMVQTWFNGEKGWYSWNFLTKQWDLVKVQRAD